MNRALVKRLDVHFSKFIRKRDSLAGPLSGYFRCCSCSQLKPINQADAGHYINRRWMTTRWREDNVHAQCRSCNRFDEGNGSGYSAFMIEKYGTNHMEYLRAVSRETSGFSDFELTMMIAEYKRKLKEV